ncbi:hypothetical protein E2C01_031192 [Portunus trituberculatus]|uniref:Uncharacterized protein n=1 Tax=Portunus trituberculatus TaxID=210409 RepID=A0A5B7EXX8_PORTR|nr:hypothetical protein [Portunus trituberculatus]
MMIRGFTDTTGQSEGQTKRTRHSPSLRTSSRRPSPAKRDAPSITLCITDWSHSEAQRSDHQ